jgi:6,7-dimethyl-8-ribityllumazine synthase
MKKNTGIRIAIISSSFRGEVARALEKNCIAALEAAGVARSQVDMFSVPGAMEIPLLAKKLGGKGIYDALIAFGAIVKGDTYHFEQIADECARGCMDVSLAYEIPVVFEVLAVYDLKDAIDRATRAKENKGVEAAETALHMIKILSAL